MLASIVYGGEVAGAIVAIGIFNDSKYLKPALTSSLAFNATALFLFTWPSSFFLLLVLRAATGFIKVFIVIYYPIWCDTYAPESIKSIWMTLLLIAGAIGVVLGYLLAHFMNKLLSWEYAYWI